MFMKKLNFWLFASLFVAAFTLSACGSDDDDDNTPGGQDGTPTSLVGKWSAFVPKWGEGLLSRYDHQLIYEFKADNTFSIKTGWYGTSTAASDAQYNITLTADEPTYPSGTYVLEGALFRFSGTYTEGSGKITFNVQKMEYFNRQTNEFEGEGSNLTDMFMWAKYDASTKDWQYLYDQSVDASAIVLPYKITGNTLTIADDGSMLVFHNHGMLTSTLTWQGK